jgi:hypothetical protein
MSTVATKQDQKKPTSRRQERVESSIKADERRELEEQEKRWAQLSAIRKIRQNFHVNQGADSAPQFGLFLLDLVSQKQRRKPKPSEKEKVGDGAQEAAAADSPQGESKSAQQSTTPNKGKPQDRERSKSPAPKQSPSLSAGPTDDRPTSPQMYISTSGICYDENGTPLMRFFPYRPSSRSPHRSSSRQGQREGERERNTTRGDHSKANNSSSSVYQAKELPPLQKVAMAKHSYGNFEYLSLLEEVAWEQRIVSKSTMPFTPCPSPFGRDTILEKKRTESTAARQGGVDRLPLPRLDSSPEFLKKKRQPGSSHLQKIADRIEARYQGSGVSIPMRDTKAMLSELRHFAEDEEEERLRQTLTFFSRERAQHRKKVLNARSRTSLGHHNDAAATPGTTRRSGNHTTAGPTGRSASYSQPVGAAVSPIKPRAISQMSYNAHSSLLIPEW